jgi:bacillithiol biosynthesis cysteine-adding enzyme BshC
VADSSGHHGRKGLDARFSGLAAALLAGRDRDLLEPLRFLAPGALPSGPAPRVDRGGIAAGLAVANAAYGHPRAAELAAKLADPATAVVATGQQVGLLGGPLLALVKAAAAVRYAEALEAAGRPAVAIFWMATEDHDFAEVASASFPGPEGVAELALGADPAPLTPVGMRAIGAGVEPIFARLAELYPSERFALWRERLAAWWRPDARFGEAFARQLVATLGARAPLALDALLPELKSAERPHLARLVERRFELDRDFAAREAEIARRAHAHQVAPQPGVSPLFLLRGPERRRIEWRGAAEFTLRGLAGARPVAELLATIDGNPAVVSPGALARPAIQDAVLGTTLQVMGPGEIGYLAQAAAVYPVLGIEAPSTALRPQALVLDARSAEHLAELGVGLQELLADPAAALRRLGERSGGGFVEPAAAAIAATLAELEAPALALDPSLAKPFEKTRETISRALEAFAGKVSGSAARRDEQTARRFAAVRDLVAPGGASQERTLSSAYFPGRYGDGFGAALLDQLDLDPSRLSVVDPHR